MTTPTCDQYDEATLTDYFAGDLGAPAEEALEEHLFACASCAAEAERVAALCTALRERIPPAITEPVRERYLRAGKRLVETSVQPGERVVVPFPLGVDLLVHRLQLAETNELDRIDLEVFDAATGNPVIAFADIAFDPSAREVNLVCQRHYAENFPPDSEFRLITFDRAGARREISYGVFHVLERTTG